MSLTIEQVNGMHEIDAVHWNAIVGDMPLLQHAFLIALEHSNSVGDESGWQPCPLLLKEDGILKGAVPLYIKYHSYGEYVFDWAWADAFEQHGLQYYPKLLSAIPFSPITSARIITTSNEYCALLIDALEQVMHRHQLSSTHVNFPDQSSADALTNAQWLKRDGVQFRWENHRFKDFDDFLATLTQKKRKNIRQERKKVLSQGINYRTIKGADITLEEWQFFFQCYTTTYLEHHSTPYLTESFFTEIGRTMPEHIVIFMAYKEGKPVASALNIYNQETLYGRYWGAIEYVPNLHFELCYYQAQIFCIKEGIRYFEGGAQGEHKLARGFIARKTCSFHQIADPRFAVAIKDYLVREEHSMSVYVNELEARSPIKSSL